MSKHRNRIAHPHKKQPSQYDRAFLSRLAQRIGPISNRNVEYDESGNLTRLNLSSRRLTAVPAEVGMFSSLKELSLAGNDLTELPANLWGLRGLERLDISGNNVDRIAPNIGYLQRLTALNLSGNRLGSLPQDIVGLTALKELRLSGTGLQVLPADVSALKELEVLDLSDNALTQLPPALSQIETLRHIDLENNPDLLLPPPEIVARGTGAVKTYLQQVRQNSTARYEAKLLVVGEGGTGKSSLLAALRGEPFDPHRSTTHGIEVSNLKLPHSWDQAMEITLNTWDFGGQQIYHATHQFFLTKRSLYLVIWNARLGAEQGRIEYWLKTIQALAPGSPVLLVATHIDERTPDINWPSYKEAFPQLLGNLNVSNRSGKGLDELRVALREQATQLPLIGQPWPRSWLDAEAALQARPEHHLSADEYSECCAAAGVDAEMAKGDCGNFLHDLGKILYFQDDDILCNLVVLKPNWITKAISRVLTDEPTREARGILSHASLSRIWERDDEGHRYERPLYPTFLRLMERFDLSYQIEADTPGDRPTHSLVPQLLPHQPPENLAQMMPDAPTVGRTEVEMLYRLSFVPSGIMSWFIVRTHRYTKGMHWRDGVVLEYEGHEARVELNPMLREIRLGVCGPQPFNFFTLLKNTLDLILKRFEGLQIERRVPCTCSSEAKEIPCPRFYLYEDLVRRMQAGKDRIECPETFQDVSVPQLLYGIHASTDRQVMEEIRKATEGIHHEQIEVHGLVEDSYRAIQGQISEISQLKELVVQNFTRLWNMEMAKMEAECPNTFVIMPSDRAKWDPRNWVGTGYDLYLVCQHPPGPHMVGTGYPLRESAEWWATVSPWLRHLLNFLIYGLPVTKSVAGLGAGQAAEHLKNQLDVMEQIAKAAGALPSANRSKEVDAARRADLGTHLQADGAALRTFYNYLVNADPAREWRGLNRTMTPDGNILWLCEEHRRPYQVRPLLLETP